jgi:uncharacterized protein
MTLPWKSALVTGASSGIGDRIARRLGAAGVDLVVVARDVDRLEALARELRSAHGVDVEVLAADLADAGSRAAVERRLASVDQPVDLLVNNAGFGTAGRFWELDVDREEQQIGLNAVALTRLTHAAIGPMVARGGGAIMNVSSLASLQPAPENAVYAATKAYVTSFSEAIHEELRGTGVTVTAVLPGFTRTEFQERAGFESDGKVPGFAWMTADAVADAAIAATAKGRAVCVPGAGYKVLAALTTPTPRSIKRRVAGAVIRRST